MEGGERRLTADYSALNIAWHCVKNFIIFHGLFFTTKFNEIDAIIISI
jgi:hypothetical protein